MKYLPKILIAFLILAVFACSKQRAISNADSNNSSPEEEYLYDTHPDVPLGEMVALNDLDSIFGNPIMCDTITQTSDDWSLYEQESQVADFLPTEIGDTLIMMRRIYGKQGGWLYWIDLEIQNSDSMRVLNFLAYDNSKVEI